jgi:anti-sigma regulatory factor (Ser/Thr protein kinase)
VPYERSTGEILDVRFEPTHLAASSVRREARKVLDASGVPPDVAGDVELIIAELATNAVEQEPGAPVRLELATTGEAVIVAVTNQTDDHQRPKRPGDAATSPGDDLPAERGWGLTIVEALGDELWIDGDERSTTVRVLRRYRLDAD